MVQQLPWLPAIAVVFSITILYDPQIQTAALETSARTTRSNIWYFLKGVRKENSRPRGISVRPVRRLGYEFLGKRSAPPYPLDFDKENETRITDKENELQTHFQGEQVDKETNDNELEESEENIKNKLNVKRRINIAGNNNNIKRLFRILFKKENDDYLGKRMGHRPRNFFSFSRDSVGSEFLGKRSQGYTPLDTSLENKRALGAEFLGKRTPEHENLVRRALGAEFLGKRALGAEFLGKRALGAEFLGKRALGAEFLGKRALGAEFLGKRALGAEFLGKRALGAEFLGKRALGAEFLGKRALGAEFLGKRALGAEFLGKRALGAEFLGKRAVGAEFLGKRALGAEFLGKRALGAEFLGKRALGREFLGKRIPEREFLRESETDNENLYRKRVMGAEFLGKRAVGSEFLGKRAMGAEFLGKRALPKSDKRALGAEFLGKREMADEGFENANLQNKFSRNDAIEPEIYRSPYFNSDILKLTPQDIDALTLKNITDKIYRTRQTLPRNNAKLHLLFEMFNNQDRSSKQGLLEHLIKNLPYDEWSESDITTDYPLEYQLNNMELNKINANPGFSKNTQPHSSFEENKKLVSHWIDKREPESYFYVKRK